MHITNTIIGIALALASRGVQATYTDGALFRQNFETASEDWDFHEELRIQDYHSHGMYHGRILRVNYTPDDRGTPRVNNKFDLEEVTSATLSFDVKLHTQFEFVIDAGLYNTFLYNTRTTILTDGTPPIRKPATLSSGSSFNARYLKFKREKSSCACAPNSKTR